jgi:hypothetical protein
MYSISFEVLPNFYLKRYVYAIEMMFPKIDLTALQSVLRTIVLFDSMSITVRKSDIEYYLIESTASIEGIEISLSILEDLDIIKFESGAYSLFARDASQLKSDFKETSIVGFQKFILRSFASISFVRGVYQMNVPGVDRVFVLDVSGLNNPVRAKKYCQFASILLGKRVLFVSRFAKVKNESIFHSVALAGMTSIFNPFGLEKLTRRHSDCIAKFPNRVVDNGINLKSLLNSPKKNTQNPVFNASGTNDSEFFTWITTFIEDKSIDANWERNQTVYRQWLLPKLSRLNRKYQLV